MKVKVIAVWNHGFIMEDDRELHEGRGMNTKESLQKYLDGMNNIKDWYITDAEDGTKVILKKGQEIEKPRRKKTKKAEVVKEKIVNTNKIDYKSLPKEELIEKTRLLMKEHKYATKVAKIVGKSAQWVRKWTAEAA